jgi:hypothetical protein
MDPSAIADENSSVYENHASVMPTLLYGNSEPVTCEIVSAKAAVSEIKVYNMQGRLLYSSQHILKAGSNKISIHPELAPGINLINISVDKKIIKTEKISVIE